MADYAHSNFGFGNAPFRFLLNTFSKTFGIEIDEQTSRRNRLHVRFPRSNIVSMRFRVIHFVFRMVARLSPTQLEQPQLAIYLLSSKAHILLAFFLSFSL